jgi:hypothetical protein
MSYTFRVIFDGVCAYVPNRPFFVNPNAPPPPPATPRTSTDPLYSVPADPASPRRRLSTDPPPVPSGPNPLNSPYSTNPVRPWEPCQVDSLAVLLPDLRRPARPSLPAHSQLNFPNFREPHFPLLTFHLGDLREGTTRRVDLVCRDISRRDEEGLLFLRREQIRFTIDAENAGQFSFAGWTPLDANEPAPDLDQREQMESLWWLPDLSRITDDPSAAQVRQNVLPSYRGPFPDGLIARVECTGGRLRTYDFNRRVDDIPLHWRFAPPADAWGTGTWNRALANSVALEFFDVRGDVHIQLRRLANEVVDQELVLAPAPGASRPVVEINISNREPDLLFQEEGFGRLTLPDVDFQPFYESLSAYKGDVSSLPIPHPARASFFGIREKPCAGTVMVAEGGTPNG